jgi:hypothetical protein
MRHFQFFYFEKLGFVENGVFQDLYVCYGSNEGGFTMYLAAW